VESGMVILSHLTRQSWRSIVSSHSVVWDSASNFLYVLLAILCILNNNNTTIRS